MEQQSLHANVHSNVSSRWRVFYTAPRAEKRCEERLQALDIESLLPKRTVVRLWKDRKKKVVEPLFPNYIFANVDEPARLRVLQTQGIVCNVTFGNQLAEVTQKEIDQLKLMQEHPGNVEVFQGTLQERGSEVCIESGPLRGLSGIVVDYRGNVNLVVEISSIRQAIRVVVPASAAIESKR